jgi:superfamily I DNA/RNA helicase
LAPTSRELWRHERALEAKGLPIASQAGKGLFRRQEVQDLLALTRVLADGGDTLAFGALMRGASQVWVADAMCGPDRRRPLIGHGSIVGLTRGARTFS